MDPTSQNFKEMLVSEFGWDRDHTKRIWAIGPENHKANILVDVSK